MGISRTGNRDNEFYQIQAKLDENDTRLTSLEADVDALQAAIPPAIPATVEIDVDSSPALADIDHDAVFCNINSSNDRTVTLPSTIAVDQVGKRFHFTASGTWSNALTVTCGLTGLMRDDSNSGAPYTVNNGVLTVTVTKGLFPYYSVSGTYS